MSQTLRFYALFLAAVPQSERSGAMVKGVAVTIAAMVTARTRVEKVNCMIMAAGWFRLIFCLREWSEFGV